jgi:hypothetical protein
MPAPYYYALLNAKLNSGGGVPVPAAFSLQSSGSGSYLSLPASAIMGSVPTDFTCEAWVNPTGSLNWHTIVGLGSVGDEFLFATWQGGAGLAQEIRFYQSGVSGGTMKQSASQIVPLGAWSHVAVTYLAATPLFTMYLNGLPAGGPSQNGNPVVHTLSSTQRRCAGDNSGDPLIGLVSEIRVWNTARTASQILANYQKRMTGSESGLIYCAPLDDGSGTARDLTSGAATGTLTGSGAAWVAGGPSFLP